MNSWCYMFCYDAFLIEYEKYAVHYIFWKYKVDEMMYEKLNHIFCYLQVARVIHEHCIPLRGELLDETFQHCEEQGMIRYV